MPKNDATYLELNTELDGILSRLQSGNLDIDEAVQCYERGTELVKQLEAYLKQAENKITKLKASFEK